MTNIVKQLKMHTSGLPPALSSLTTPCTLIALISCVGPGLGPGSSRPGTRGSIGVGHVDRGDRSAAAPGRGRGVVARAAGLRPARDGPRRGVEAVIVPRAPGA